LWPAL